jgi:hypothetical protein
MAEPKSRLRLIDLVYFVAACALCMGLERSWLPRSRIDLSLADPSWKMYGGDDLWRHLRSLIRALDMIFPVLVVWTPAWLAIRLAKPRPDWSSLRRQPGFVAVGLASLTLFSIGLARFGLWLVPILPEIPSLARRAIDWTARTDTPFPALVVDWADCVTRGWPSPVELVTYLFFDAFLWITGPVGGIAVALGWIALWRTHRWTSERSWIDRGGVLLGVLWIAAAMSLALAIATGQLPHLDVRRSSVHAPFVGLTHDLRSDMIHACSTSASETV